MLVSLEGTPPKATEGIPNLMGLGRVDSLLDMAM